METGKLKPAHRHYTRIGERVCEEQKEREKNPILLHVDQCAVQLEVCPLCVLLRRHHVERIPGCTMGLLNQPTLLNIDGLFTLEH